MVLRKRSCRLNHCGKYESFNWHVLEIDGHNFEDIIAATARRSIDRRANRDHCTYYSGQGVTLWRMIISGTRNHSSRGRQVTRCQSFGPCRERSRVNTSKNTIHFVFLSLINAPLLFLSIEYNRGMTKTNSMLWVVFTVILLVVWVFWPGSIIY